MRIQPESYGWLEDYFLPDSNSVMMDQMYNTVIIKNDSDLSSLEIVKFNS